MVLLALCLVPIAIEIGWRRITINGHRATLNIVSRNRAAGAGIPLSVPGYDDRRIVLLRLPDQASLNGTNGHPVTAQVTVSNSPDSGLGSLASGSSDGVPEADYHGLPRPMFKRQMARRGRPRLYNFWCGQAPAPRVVFTFIGFINRNMYGFQLCFCTALAL